MIFILAILYGDKLLMSNSLQGDGSANALNAGIGSIRGAVSGSVSRNTADVRWSFCEAIDSVP